MTSDFLPARFLHLIDRCISIGTLCCKKQHMIQRIHLAIANQMIALLQAGHILFARIVAAHGYPLEIPVS